MSNLPLKALPWEPVKYAGGAANDAQGAGIYYRAIQRDGKHIVFWVDSMGGSDGDKSFDSWNELKDWVETTHYPHKMQPYVVPSPTWISVDDRLPEYKEMLSDKDKCVVLTECGKVWTGFYNMHVKPDDWYLHGWTEKQGWHPFKIVAWMLASDLSKQGE